MGLVYYEGRGAPRDYEAAFKWSSLAAEQGNANGQYHCGKMYYLGNGVEGNIPLAYMWFSPAAEQGQEDASSYLEEMKRSLASEVMSTASYAAGRCKARQYKDCDTLFQ